MRWPFRWIDDTTNIPDHYDTDEAREEVCRKIDSRKPPFDKQATWVAASGFLTDSYNLFATNVILPTLAYLYWPQVSNGEPELLTNVITLAGSIIGQLSFGLFADLFGRRRLYGLELTLVLVGTLAMFEASSGYDNSMDIKGWIYFARFLTGVGIGAEYPLSAVITAEFAPAAVRAQMLAAVFFMQPLGQLIAAGVGWSALVGLVSPFETGPATPPNTLPRELDIVWRTTVAAGALPALVAIVWRFSIPESPRYTMDVARDGKRAIADIYQYRNARKVARNAAMARVTRNPARQSQNLGTGAPSHKKQSRFEHFRFKSLKEYFWTEGNWRYLFATSLTWFLLDFAFFGLGINNPGQLDAIYARNPAYTSKGADWKDPYIATASDSDIYHTLYNNASQYIWTVSIASMIGSITMLCFIDTISRKTWLIASFVILAFLFAIVAAILDSTEFTSSYEATVVFYSLSQFFFNFGPNTLTFIIPAEIFPTRYRCICHGISAAFGKLGSIAVLLLLHRPEFGGDDQKAKRLNVPLGIFAGFMALGAFVAWIWLPNLQGDFVKPERPWRFGILPSKKLEILARGRKWAIGDPPTELEMALLKEEDLCGDQNTPVWELSKDAITRINQDRILRGEGKSSVGEGQRIGFRMKMVDLFPRIRARAQRSPTSALEMDDGGDPASPVLEHLTEEPESL